MLNATAFSQEIQANIVRINLWIETKQTQELDKPGKFFSQCTRSIKIP